ncbi:MAG: hypothetical protein ABI824_12330 [Acidobacteriota bacterium]
MRPRIQKFVGDKANAQLTGTVRMVLSRINAWVWRTAPFSPKPRQELFRKLR